ncbi:STIV orfB116 family protein [Sulfuracidifex metallicus]|uniref:STIV orfB116 family protein n=1 Tax=Sulfuracidifex metallicus TaxID=47303 RepID=UPI0022765ADA|nr:DUF1874 domain-containing protein [Sulfuracidifex metallicus]MCY0851071.1 DUF1874 domain-containing protein [Sulfuracidifex metallicus]
MALYLLNSLIIPIQDNEAEFKIKRISISEARDIVDNSRQVISAIGHSATASVMSALLGFPVETNRISVYFKVGDSAIAIVLRQRLPEGHVIQSEEELQRIGYDLYYILRTG